jgi:hypothetical protein
MHKMLVAVGGRIAALLPRTAPEELCTAAPLPGLFGGIGSRFGVLLKGVPTVGDSGA